MAEQIGVFTTLRYDPALPDEVHTNAVDSYPDTPVTPFYLLRYHQDRLLHAAKCLEWADAVLFLEKPTSQFVEFLDGSIPDKTTPWRLRVVVDSCGNGTAEAFPASTVETTSLLISSALGISSEAWSVYVDSEPTIPSKYTTHKTTARDHYTAARHRCGILSLQAQAEVLLINPEGEVMEGSITSVYLRCRRSVAHDDQSECPEWVTPPLSSGGNAGTTRRYALGHGFCSERQISAAELVDGEECWLSNAVRGFIRGTIVLKR